MICASFIFKVSSYDDVFHTLNHLLAEAVRATDGYIGSESWYDKDGRINAMYYWQDKTGLQAFAQHPKHLEAKQHYKRWYAGFQVIISEVLTSYGDGQLEHITPNSRLSQ